jgi:hypothetical protein
MNITARLATGFQLYGSDCGSGYIVMKAKKAETPKVSARLFNPALFGCAE